MCDEHRLFGDESAEFRDVSIRVSSLLGREMVPQVPMLSSVVVSFSYRPSGQFLFKRGGSHSLERRIWRREMSQLSRACPLARLMQYWSLRSSYGSESPTRVADRLFMRSMKAIRRWSALMPSEGSQISGLRYSPVARICSTAEPGRVKMWCGGLRLGLSVGRPYCLAVP